MPATTLVGLDIGSASIRAVEATIGQDRPVINNFGQAFLTPGTVVGGVVKDDRAVTAALRQLWVAHDFGTRDVVLGVTHQQVVVREMEIPNLPLKERRQALPFLVRDVLPIPADQAILDFYPLEKPGKGDTVRGLLIAAPKDPVIGTVRAVEAAGLHVVSVDLSCFAALRASAHLARDTEALVDIGANGTNIIVHADGTPEDRPLGAARRGRDHQDGRQPARPEHRRGRDDQVPRRAQQPTPTPTAPRSSTRRSGRWSPRSAARSTTSPSTTGGTAIKRLALVGGAALLPGLPERLTEELGVLAFLSDPLQRVHDPRKGGRHDSLGRFRSSAAVSIGLTLGAA